MVLGKNIGFSALPNTSGGFHNGIALTADESTLFINYWFTGKTIRQDIFSGEVQATHMGGKVDNLTVFEGYPWTV